MPMKEIKSFEDLLVTARGFHTGDEGGIVDAMMRRHDNLGEFAKALNGTYIINYQTGEYLLSDTTMCRIAGYSVEEVQQLVRNPKSDLWHRQDQEIVNRLVYPTSLAFLSQLPVEQHKDYLLTTNYRIRTKSGQTKNIRQQSYFIKSADDGTPLIALGYVEDITAITIDNRISHTLTNIASGASEISPDYSNMYFVREHKLTKREGQIMAEIGEGYTRKEIAQRLFIAEHTVNSHIQNISEKIGLNKNTDMRLYALRNGYLN